MDDETRITKDIVMFEKNIEKIKKVNLSDPQIKTFTLAKQYYEDSKYYFQKKDYFTSFGCINYAHGLLDALIKF